MPRETAPAEARWPGRQRRRRRAQGGRADPRAGARGYRL